MNSSVAVSPSPPANVDRHAHAGEHVDGFAHDGREAGQYETYVVDTRSKIDDRVFSRTVADDEAGALDECGARSLHRHAGQHAACVIRDHRRARWPNRRGPAKNGGLDRPCLPARGGVRWRVRETVSRKLTVAILRISGGPAWATQEAQTRPSDARDSEGRFYESALELGSSP